MSSLRAHSPASLLYLDFEGSTHINHSVTCQLHAVTLMGTAGCTLSGLLSRGFLAGKDLHWDTCTETRAMLLRARAPSLRRLRVTQRAEEGERKEDSMPGIEGPSRAAAPKAGT